MSRATCTAVAPPSRVCAMACRTARSARPTTQPIPYSVRSAGRRYGSTEPHGGPPLPERPRRSRRADGRILLAQGRRQARPTPPRAPMVAAAMVAVTRPYSIPASWSVARDMQPALLRPGRRPADPPTRPGRDVASHPRGRPDRPTRRPRRPHASPRSSSSRTPESASAWSRCTAPRTSSTSYPRDDSPAAISQ